MYTSLKKSTKQIIRAYNKFKRYINFATEQARIFNPHIPQELVDFTFTAKDQTTPKNS